MTRRWRTVEPIRRVATRRVVCAAPVTTAGDGGVVVVAVREPLPESFVATQHHMINVTSGRRNGGRTSVVRHHGLRTSQARWACARCLPRRLGRGWKHVTAAALVSMVQCRRRIVVGTSRTVQSTPSYFSIAWHGVDLLPVDRDVKVVEGVKAV